MPNLDDLINDIYKDEAIDIPGSLSSKEQQRVEERILSQTQVVYHKFSNRKRVVLVLAAVLLLLLGVTSFAAIANDWDVALLNFMGISDSTTLQLESGEVEIGESCTYNGVEITAVSSIGDKNSAYIRLNTNIELPEDFDETRDYVLPEDISYYVSTKPQNGSRMASPHASVTTYFQEEGKLGFLIEISDCEDLNKSYVTIQFQDLYLYHDLNLEDGDIYEEKELLCEGLWELSWKYSYQSNMETHRMLKKTVVGDSTCYLTKVEISPISIRLEGYRTLEDREKPWCDEGECWLEAIYYKNGEYISLDDFSSGGIRDGIWMESFTNVLEFGEVICPEDIDYLIIGGEKIYL